MLCTNCGKNNADTYVRKSGGREIRLTLCPDCYRALYGKGAAELPPLPVKRCLRCGTTLEDFRRTRLLGCADCYRVFREEIMPTVRYVQGKTRHEGTPPKFDGGNYDLAREREDVKESLERALREGRYEEAERLTEQLKKINGILYRGEQS